MLEKVVQRIVFLDEMLFIVRQIRFDDGKVVLAQHLKVQGSVQCHGGTSDLSDGFGRMIAQEPCEPFTTGGDALHQIGLEVGRQ